MDQDNEWNPFSIQFKYQVPIGVLFDTETIKKGIGIREGCEDLRGFQDGW